MQDDQTEQISKRHIITMDRSQNYAFFRIYLYYISFALHLHFICILHYPPELVYLHYISLAFRNTK